MLKLRKAVETDFETFKTFFENKNENEDYHWLYYDFNYSTKREEPTEKEKMEWKDVNKLIDKELKNYTLQRFMHDIKSNYIYMIARDSECVGYIDMYYYTKWRYKICDWAILYPKDEELKREVAEELLKLKLPRLKEYDVCAGLYVSVILSLWDIGFRPTGSMRTGFWKLEVPKEESENK